jgi:hypothetical protein
VVFGWASRATLEVEMQRWIRRLPKRTVIAAALAAVAAAAVPALAAIGSSRTRPPRHADEAQDRALIRQVKRGPRGYRGPRGLRGPQGSRGPTGARGARGPGGPAGPAGTARAYGVVSAAGALNTARSLHVASVAHTAGTGVYCITLANGIDPSRTLAVASIDAPGATPASRARFNSASTNCGAGKLEVDTATEAVSGTPPTLTATAADAGFSFAVP